MKSGVAPCALTTFKECCSGSITKPKVLHALRVVVFNRTGSSARQSPPQQPAPAMTLRNAIYLPNHHCQCRPMPCETNPVAKGEAIDSPFALHTDDKYWSLPRRERITSLQPPPTL